MTGGRTFLAWVLAGLGFGLGVLAVALGTMAFERYAERSRERVDNPAQLHVHDLAPVPFAERLIVTGSLRNDGPSVFEGGYVEVALMQDGGRLFTCGGGVHEEVLPGASSPIQIACDAIRTDAVPAGVRFEATIRRAGFRAVAASR